MARTSDADFIVEAVFEEMDVKKQVFTELSRLAGNGAVIATNTSYLNVDEIAAATDRPQDVVGTHFFSPANVMRLLEIARAEKTAPDVLATAVELARRIGKVPVVVGVCHGFVGNRMLSARSWEAEQLLLEGALPQEVDGALVEFGFPMGPFAMGDLAGLDVGWRMRKANNLTAAIADALCEQGRFGQKTGRGFYIYEKGSRAPAPDPEVEALIEDISKRLGIERRSVDQQEIIERLLYPLVSEGAQILDEGVARRPSDIDVVWVYGYGFPAWRGGPMYWADSIGLATIRDRLKHYARGNMRLAPAPLLERLAEERRGFASLEQGKEAA
jgi:3-hydroxyacyl-CoA dehydrogenase